MWQLRHNGAKNKNITCNYSISINPCRPLIPRQAPLPHGRHPLKGFHHLPILRAADLGCSNKYYDCMKQFNQGVIAYLKKNPGANAGIGVREEAELESRSLDPAIIPAPGPDRGPYYDEPPPGF
jgi:hypothetical protein